MSILGITYNDFGKGKYELHHGMYEQAKIQQYIDKYEKQTLIKLLGVELFNEFVLDLVGNVPQSAKYLKIYNPFEYENDSCNIHISEGMIDMVKGFVYYQYLKDLTNTVAISGNVRPKGENSENVSTLNSMIYTRYNDSVRTLKSIQFYICDYSNDYLNYNGVTMGTVYWI